MRTRAADRVLTTGSGLDRALAHAPWAERQRRFAAARGDGARWLIEGYDLRDCQSGDEDRGVCFVACRSDEEVERFFVRAWRTTGVPARRDLRCREAARRATSRDSRREGAGGHAGAPAARTPARPRLFLDRGGRGAPPCRSDGRAPREALRRLRSDRAVGRPRARLGAGRRRHHAARGSGPSRVPARHRDSGAGVTRWLVAWRAGRSVTHPRAVRPGPYRPA